jgi:aryl-alcohol dehydrogenase-like predicted oxidoreductase
MSVTTLAVTWSKQHDFVASMIVGAKSPEKMLDILAAAAIELSQETLSQIDSVTKEIRYLMG